jgi:hypothetical protein
MMTITMQMPLLPGFTTRGQKLFKKRSAQAVYNINARLKKIGLTARITLEAGRAALAAGVGKPCRYCKELIKIATMSPDHPTPVSRGGDPLKIECICLSCNHEKGELDSAEFERFYAHVRTYRPESQRYIHGMMRAGAAYQRVKGKMVAMRKKTEAAKGANNGNSGHA